MTDHSTPLLELDGVSVRFRTAHGVVQALTEANVMISPSETLVLIGESGSGKTVLAHALLRLLPLNAEVSGAVYFEGQNLLSITEEAMQRIRGRRISLIPQSPGSSLNPVRRLGSQLLEAMRVLGYSEDEGRSRLSALFTDFDLDWDRVSRQYPHQLSGGMQQRVVNALAMAGEPALVVADEPTYGLDSNLVSTTAAQLRQIGARGSALLVITHDLRLARELGGRTALIYASHIIELQPTSAFFERPLHPYGAGLLSALPENGGHSIPGLPPELSALPQGCAFLDRCEHRVAQCEHQHPPLYPIASADSFVECYQHAPR